MRDHSLPDAQPALLNHLATLPLWNDVADTETIVASAITIQQIPAPTFDEEQRARYVRDQMEAIGLAQVHMDDLHNVYGCIQGQKPGPGVLITAHTDTVFARDVDLAVRRDDGRVYGPGIGDNSISVAALLHLARVLHSGAVPIERTLWFVANTGEEGLGDLRGMRAVIERLHHDVNAVIVLDAQFGMIVHEGVASRRYRIGVRAAGGHSWQDFGATSAVHVLVRLAARLAEMDVPATPKCTFNIGVIHGGTTVNAIAQEAHLLLDLRSVDEQHVNRMADHVSALVAALRLEHPDATITQELVGNRPGGGLPADHPLVQQAIESYRAVGATVVSEIASTDANVPLSAGIPTVCVGMRVGGNAHRLDEYMEIEAIPAGMRAALLLVLAAISGAAPATIRAGG